MLDVAAERRYASDDVTSSESRTPSARVAARRRGCIIRITGGTASTCRVRVALTPRSPAHPRTSTAGASTPAETRGSPRRRPPCFTLSCASQGAGCRGPRPPRRGRRHVRQVHGTHARQRAPATRDPGGRDGGRWRRRIQGRRRGRSGPFREASRRLDGGPQLANTSSSMAPSGRSGAAPTDLEPDAFGAAAARAGDERRADDVTWVREDPKLEVAMNGIRGGRRDPGPPIPAGGALLTQLASGTGKRRGPIRCSMNYAACGLSSVRPLGRSSAARRR